MTFRRQLLNAAFAVAVYVAIRGAVVVDWAHPGTVQGWYGANLESIVLGAPFSFVVGVAAQFLAHTRWERVALALAVGVFFGILFSIV
jgi:heme/copper-type cytochrome/quinol oxidase subunit 3